MTEGPPGIIMLRCGDRPASPFKRGEIGHRASAGNSAGTVPECRTSAGHGEVSTPKLLSSY